VRILKDLDIDSPSSVSYRGHPDSRFTLSTCAKSSLLADPESLAVCSLLVKRRFTAPDLELAYVGFEIEPEFVVGYA